MQSYQKVCLIFLITAASVMATCISPELCFLAQFFKVQSSKLSAAMSIYLMGYLGGQYFFSIIARKYNGILSIRLGLLVAVAGFCLQYISLAYVSYEIFLSGRFLSAFGLSAGLVIGFAIIKNNISPDKEKKYLSFISVSFMGFIYGSILITGWLTEALKINYFFLGFIGYSLLLLAVTFFIPNTEKSRPISVSFSDFQQLFNIKLIAYSFALAMTTLIAYCYAFYAPLIFIKTFKLSMKSFGHYNLINLLGVLVGSFFYPPFSKMIREEKLIFLILGLLIISMWILISAENKNSVHFIAIFFTVNMLSGLLYPAATYIALGCGNCKTISSTTMNITKIGVPTIALSFSTFLKIEEMLKLSITIVSFAMLSIFFVLISAYSKERALIK